MAVSARRVTRTFPGGAGVHDLDLAIAPGTIFGFIGPSGSGKTTTVRLFTGLLSPQAGELEVLGKSPSRFNRSDRGRLGYLPQLSVLYPELSLVENLNFAASLFGVPWRGRRRLVGEMLDLVELEAARGRRLRDASGGMQRRLALAATLIHDPDALFLDEPTAGIDPVLRKKFWDHFAGLREGGRTLFVTTQYVGEAAYCDRVGVLADGRLLAVDTPDGLRRLALGGEVVDMTLTKPIDAVLRDRIGSSLEAIRSERLAPNVVRLVVESAGDTVPRLSAWATEAGLEVESIDQYLPPFDDVFVELVSQLAPEEPNGEAAS
jgi:ABC-2 type transport system ATP-binding protein